MERLFLMFLDHTQRCTTVSRTPLDELITRPEESCRLCCVVVCDLETSRMGAPYIYDISSLRVKSLNFCSGLLEDGYIGEWEHVAGIVNKDCLLLLLC